MARLEREVADRVKAENQVQLLRVSRLSAMGAMAATIAHELNQPLAASANYLAAAEQIAKDNKVGPASLVEALGKAKAQGVKATEIIRRVRAFTTRGEVARQAEQPVELLNAALSTVQTRIERTHVDLTIISPAELPRISVDRVQIEQVLTNVLRNAIDAVADCTTRHIKAEIRTALGVVQFRITDSGPGIPKTGIDGLFQPFKSSKPDGMGLGLPLCRTIVEAHGGRIWAEQGEGGASFVVAFPAL